MDASMFWWVAALIVLLLDLWVLNSVWRSTQNNGRKIFWTLIIFILPIVGLVVWGLMGPRGLAESPTSDTHSKG